MWFYSARMRNHQFDGEDDSYRFIYEYKEFVDDHEFSKLLDQFIVTEERKYYSYLKLLKSKQITIGEQVTAIANEVLLFIEKDLRYTKLIKK